MKWRKEDMKAVEPYIKEYKTPKGKVRYSVKMQTSAITTNRCFKTLQEAQAYKADCLKQREEKAKQLTRPNPINNFEPYKYGYPYNLLKDLGINNVSKFDEKQALKLIDDLTTNIKIKTRQNNFLMLYYKCGKNYAEIGRIHNLSRERVRQIMAKTMLQLKYCLNAENVIFLSQKEVDNIVYLINQSLKNLDDKKQLETNLKKILRFFLTNKD